MKKKKTTTLGALINVGRMPLAPTHGALVLSLQECYSSSLLCTATKPAENLIEEADQSHLKRDKGKRFIFFQCHCLVAFFIFWFIKLPTGKHGKWHFRGPNNKNFLKMHAPRPPTARAFGAFITSASLAYRPLAKKPRYAPAALQRPCTQLLVYPSQSGRHIWYPP